MRQYQLVRGACIYNKIVWEKDTCSIKSLWIIRQVYSRRKTQWYWFNNQIIFFFENGRQIINIDKNNIYRGTAQAKQGIRKTKLWKTKCPKMGFLFPLLKKWWMAIYWKSLGTLMLMVSVVKTARNYEFAFWRYCGSYFMGQLKAHHNAEVVFTLRKNDCIAKQYSATLHMQV